MFTEHCDQARRRFWASLPKKHLGSTFKIFQNPLQFGSGNEKLRSEIRVQGSLRHSFGRLLQKKNYRQHGKLPRSATICGLLSMRTTSTYIVERNVDALIHVHYIVQLQRNKSICSTKRDIITLFSRFISLLGKTVHSLVNEFHSFLAIFTILVMVKILLNCFLKNSDGKNFTQLLFEKTVMVKILLNCFLKKQWW